MLLTFSAIFPGLPDGVTIRTARRYSWQVGSYTAYYNTPPCGQDPGRFRMEGCHLLMFHPMSINYLVQIVPGFTLEARGVGHWPHWDLRRSHLLIDIAAVPSGPHMLELNAVAFVEQSSSSWILD